MFMSCEQKAGQYHDVKTGNIGTVEIFLVQPWQIKIACLEELKAKLTQGMPTAWRHTALGLFFFLSKRINDEMYKTVFE